MLRIENFVREEIEIRLKDFEGYNVYLSELGYKLFEYENCNCIYSCSTYEAIQWIKNYFEELDEIVEEYENNFGYSVPSPFSEPEKFQLIIILYLSDKLVNNAIYNAALDLDMDSEIELTNDIINTILEVL